MSSNDDGTGSFTPNPSDPDFSPEREGGPDHMKGWSGAVEDALQHFGRDAQDEPYDVELTLSAKVRVTNPGNIVEYGAKFN